MGCMKPFNEWISLVTAPYDSSKNILTLDHIYERFPDRKSCIEHLEKVIWGENPICPYCETIGTYGKRSDLKYLCSPCGMEFMVTYHTPYHRTHMPLQKWFVATSLFIHSEGDISPQWLAEVLDVADITVYRMGYFILKSLREGDFLRIIDKSLRE